MERDSLYFIVSFCLNTNILKWVKAHFEINLIYRKLQAVKYKGANEAD